MVTQALVGQKTILNGLIQQHKKGYFPHCQLFVDDQGYGGLALAVALSHHILLQHQSTARDVAPSHPDLHFLYPTLTNSKIPVEEVSALWVDFYSSTPYGTYSDWLSLLDAGNKQGSIRVEAIHELHRKASLKSYSGKEKLFIIWGADLILEPAANKLLKLLEEPPSNTYFILICEHADSLLPTIRSRCQITKLHPISNDELRQAALSAYPETKDIENMVAMARGSWRRMTRVLDNFEERKSLEALWVQGLRLAFRARGNKKIVLELFDWAKTMAQKERETQKYFMLYGLDLIRNALMIQYRAEEIHHYHSLTGFDISKFANYVHANNIIPLQQLLEDSHYYLSRNANAKILFSHFSLELSRLLNAKAS